MTLQTVQLVRTSDGKLFENASEAEVHQSQLDAAEFVEEFLVKANITGRTAAMLKRHLVNFHVFSKTGTPLEVVAPPAAPKKRSAKKEEDAE